MLSLLKRYRELLVVTALLVSPLIAFLTSGHRGREFNFLDRSVLAISSPIERALSWAVSGVGSAVSGYIALRGVRERNLVLESENSKLRARSTECEEETAENARLKKLVGYVQTTPDEEIAARIIGVNPSATFLSVRIDRGSADGVKQDMPVVTADGVIGRVHRAGSGFSDVRLITDPSSKLGVMVQRSRVRATAAGAGGNKPLLLETVLRTEELQDGDLIVTSGTDGIFPKGLIVGKVTGLKRSDSGMFLTAGIVPAVDASRLEELLVLPVLGSSGSATPREETR